MATQRFALLLLITAVILTNVAVAEDRSINGVGNNVSNTTLGSANQPLIRFNYKPDFPNNQMITDAHACQRPRHQQCDRRSDHEPEEARRD